MTTFATIDIATLTVKFFPHANAAENWADKHDSLVATSAEDLQELTGPQAVAVYNATAEELDTNIAPVKRFATKDAAAKRLWANITDLQEARAERAKAAAPKASAPRRGTGINLAPKEPIRPCREGTKQSILVDMLSRKQGATMAELTTGLSGGNKPWQEVTVKSGLNWDMNKIKGYGIRTSQRDGADCYHLVLPEGMEAPLPHTKKKG